MPAAPEPGAANDVVGGRYRLTAPAPPAGARDRWHAHDQLLDRAAILTKVPLPPSPGDRDAQRAAAMREARADLTVLDVVDTPAALWLVTSPAAPRPPAAEASPARPVGPAPASAVAPVPGEPPSAATPAPPVGAAARQPSAASPASPVREAPRLTIGGLPVPLPAAGNRGGGRLGAAARANPGLAVGVATGVIMIAALILVTLLFPSHRHPAQPPGRPGTSPAATATPLPSSSPGSG